MKIITIMVLALAAVCVNAAVAEDRIRVDVSTSATKFGTPVPERPPQATACNAAPASSEFKRLKARVAELENQLLWVGPRAEPSAVEASAALPPDRADPGVNVRSRVLPAPKAEYDELAARTSATLKRADAAEARANAFLRKGDWGHDGQFFYIRKALVARLSGSPATPEFLCDLGEMNRTGHRCEGQQCRPIKTGGLMHHWMSSDGDFWVAECAPTRAGKVRWNVFVNDRYVPDHNESEWEGTEGHPNDSGRWFVINFA